MHHLTLPALALTLGVAALTVGAVAAKPLTLLGGADSGGGTVTPPSSSLCSPGLTGDVCATFQSGQTFVIWTDMATGAAGDGWRYSMYRSTAPITSGNYTSATLIASYILNNSGHLRGGNRSTGTGMTYAQSIRQSAAQPIARRSDLGASHAYGTGCRSTLCSPPRTPTTP